MFDCGAPPHLLQVTHSTSCLCAGPVTNAIITAAPANMFLPDSRPAVPLPRFSRHLNSPEGDGSEAGEVCVRLGLYTQVREAFRSETSRSASRYLGLPQIGARL